MSFMDLDNEALAPSDSVGAARISKADIWHEIQLTKVELEKKEPKGEKKGYEALRLVFENKDGEVHEEVYFKPPSTVAELSTTSDWTPDKYEEIEGKKEKVGKVSREDYVKILNNDFAYFLLDLADALGFALDKAKVVLMKAKNFEQACKIFKDTFCKDLKTKKISMKLLWDNNDKDKSSYLRLHHFMTYYPFKNDIFDNWGKDRKTVLHISDYDKKKKMEPKYQNERKSSGTATNTGTTSNSAYQEAAGSTDAEADPF